MKVSTYIDLIVDLMNKSDEIFNTAIPFDPKNKKHVRAREVAKEYDDMVIDVINKYEQKKTSK